MPEPASSAFDDLTGALRELTNEVRSLRDEIKAGRPPVVTYREVSKEQAINEIAALLKAESELYPSDISDRLSIDYFAVLDALEVLRLQGKVE